MVTKKEEFTISGDKIVEKVKEIIKEGNARRIIVKNEKGEEIAEFPLTAGAVSIDCTCPGCIGSYCCLVN